MNNIKKISLGFLSALALLAPADRLAAQGTAFNYQGCLYDGASPANGSYDLTLALFNAGSLGLQTGTTLTNLAVGVTNGLFTVTADFGAVFDGTAYWLQIGVRTNGAASFTPLNPRQELTPVPYSITAQNLTGILPLAQLPATVALLSDPGAQNFFAGQSAGNGSLSGAGNTGIGFGALSWDISGSLNTAQGYNALFINQTGSNNSAFGAFALEYNLSGNNNTGTGTYALSAAFVGPDLTGGGNTADGAYALTDDETGYNNTAVGFQSLYNNTTGFDNIGIGVNAFQANSVGFQNTAVGTYAFQNMTAGTGNIGLGYIAGQNLSAGTNNIYIGSPGASADNEVIRIGNGQAQTFIAGTIQSPTADRLLLAGGGTDNGLQYATSGLIGVPGGGAGAFLFGFNGGSLGTVSPMEVSLSWDYNGNVWVSNNLSTATLTIRGGADLAEPFNITSGQSEVAQGAVVVIDDQNPGHLKLSESAYDTRVAGVVSGANGINPGIQMHQQGLLEGGKNVALTGRVYVQADTSNGPIKPGDLLTSSATPGHAMKVTDHARASGAILGKAMTGLSEGKGMVLVLVTLQ